MRSRGRFRITVPLCSALAVALAAGHAPADDFDWNQDAVDPPFGPFHSWHDPAHWDLLSGSGPAPPGSGDLAWFRLPSADGVQAYEVTVGQTAFCAELRFTNSAGPVHFYSTSSGHNLLITSGVADLLVSGASDVQFGQEFRSPVDVTVGDTTTVSSDSELRVTNGSSLTTTNLQLGGFGDGTLEIGDGASLNVTGTGTNVIGAAGSLGKLEVLSVAASANMNGPTEVAVSSADGTSGSFFLSGGTDTPPSLDDDVIIGGGAGDQCSGAFGAGGGQATLDDVFVGGGSGADCSHFFNVSFGTITMADLVVGGFSGANSSAEVEFQNADVTIANMTLGGGTSASSSSEVAIDGSLTMAGAAVLTVGGPAGTESAVVEVGIEDLTQTTGHLTTGSGLTSVHPTGTVLMEGVDSTLEFGGDVLIDGGTVDLTEGTLTLAADSDVNATNNATVNLTNLDVEQIAEVIIDAATTVTTNEINIGTTGAGTLILDGSGTTLAQNSGFTCTVGNTGIASALLSISNQAVFDTSDGLTTIANTGAAEVVSNAMLNINGDLLVDGGTLDAGGGTVDFAPGISITVQNNGVVTTGGGLLNVGNQASVDLLSGGTLNFPGTVALNDSATLLLDGGNAVLGNLEINDGLFSFLAGTLDLAGDFTIDDDLFLNDEMTLNVGGDTDVYGPAELIVAGGTFDANALNLFAGSTFEFGESSSVTVDGPVFAAGGALIDAQSTLALGDGAAVDGFYCNGMLMTGEYSVTVNDANDAVFDSGALVSIGFPGAAGTLSAPNGVTFDFGANVLGYGTVDTPDDPATPLTHNGSILGDSPDEPITLTGYVTGVGDFDNAVFAGTYAPGFSPASIVTGSTTYAGTLEIELGGTAPGSQHDQVNHILADGVSTLGGTLQVTLIDDFQPSIGDEFVIITADSVNGQFDAYDGPANLEIIYEPTRVLLGVTGSCPADLANSDGVVNVFDLLELLAGWGTAGNGSDLDEPNDIVNVFDLLTLLAAWGNC